MCPGSSVKVMLDAYDEGRIDRLYVVYNEFVNTMTQSPEVVQLLPLQAAEENELQHHWDYIYEPEAKDLLDGLLTRYIESQVYQSVVENVACEQAARMVAMKAATDNAGDIGYRKHKPPFCSFSEVIISEIPSLVYRSNLNFHRQASPNHSNKARFGVKSLIDGSLDVSCPTAPFEN